MLILATVATFDPIKSTGFLKVLTPAPVRQVHFNVQKLPPEVRAALYAASPELAKSRRFGLTTTDFKRAMKAAHDSLKGKRFACDIEMKPDGHARIRTGTMRLVVLSPMEETALKPKVEKKKAKRIERSAAQRIADPDQLRLPVWRPEETEPRRRARAPR